MSYTMEAWEDEYETTKHSEHCVASMPFTVKKGEPAGVGSDDIGIFVSEMLAAGYSVRLGADCRDKSGNIRKAVVPVVDWLSKERKGHVDVMIKWGDACPSCRRTREAYAWHFCPFCGTKYKGDE